MKDAQFIVVVMMMMSPLQYYSKIRSCFAMTEPGVASSDASQISTRIDLSPDRQHYIINGHKWYISGAMRPECKVAVLLGKLVNTPFSFWP